MEALASLCCWSSADTTSDETSETKPLLEAESSLPFVYSSFAPDEIRLLVLHPATSFDAPLEAHLQIAKRSDGLSYEAVSYAWGSEETEVSILMHYEQHSASRLYSQNALITMCRSLRTSGKPRTSLRIKKNVATMLRYFRYLLIYRYLWIDAICINQNDNREKGQQVNGMGDTYRRSQSTLIWLGSSGRRVKPLLALAATETTPDSELVRKTRLRPGMERLRPLQMGILTDIKYGMNLRYYHYFLRRHDGTDFMQLLVSVYSARCSDDRDQIYALNNLRHEPEIADYQRSTDDVFIAFATTECKDSLETLYFSGAFPSSNGLPSWAPDWRSSRQWIPIKSLKGRPPSLRLLFDSPRESTPSPQKPVFIDPVTMSLNAVIFTFVATKGLGLFENWTLRPWQCLTRYLEFFSCKPDLGRSVQENDTYKVEDFGRLVTTLSAGAITSGDNLRSWLEAMPTVPARTNDSFSEMICRCDDISFCEYDDMHSNNLNILDKMSGVMKGRCTFITDGGDWAVVPASLSLGDFLVALPGCSYPLVMRMKVRTTRVCSLTYLTVSCD
jgi:hypothetical protein